MVATTAGPGTDRFDDIRREWIARHQGWSTIQQRRAEQLGRKVRARQRAQAVAVPDPHDDTSLPPLWLRSAQSPASQLELCVVLTLVVLAPGGFFGGYLLKVVVTRLIPDRLRGYPVWALLTSSGVLLAVSTLLYLLVYRPGASLGQLAVMPWVCAQVVAVFAVAGVYGIADGWLAVPASRLWLPRTPPPPPLSAEVAEDILGAYDLNGPGLLDVQQLNTHGQRTR